MKVVKSRAFKDRLKGHKDATFTLFSPLGVDGHLLYTLSRDGSFRGWDLAKREIATKSLLDRRVKTKEERQLALENEENQDKGKGDDKAVQKEQLIAACFTPNRIFGSYQDGCLMQWEFSNQADIVREYIGHSQRVSCIFVVPEKNQMISGSHDGTIRRWSTQSGQLQTVYNVAGPVHQMRRTGPAQLMAVVSRNIVFQINFETNSVVRCMRFGKHSFTSFYSQDNLLVISTISNLLLVYDLNKFDAAQPDNFPPMKLIEGLGGSVLVMDPNNGNLYTGCDDKKIRIYRWPQVEEVQQLTGHEDGVISFAFADNMMFSGSYDHSIRSWDIKEMTQRVSERAMMSFEDLETKRYEVYYTMVFKNKKKKLPAKKKK